MKVYKNAKPEQPYSVVSKIESHLKRNFFLGGKVSLESEGFQELKQQGCALGGDAVIIDDAMETAVSEMTHVHIWATVVKFAETVK